jgi:hypothetical protein
VNEIDDFTPQRKRYAYRLLVTYPELDDPWVGPDTDAARAWLAATNDPNGDQVWRWPAVKTYLSSTAANRKANLLRSLGCSVIVERSNPITWGAT